ncbi:MAG TPA: hypothetical protein VMR21_10070 [Vicinamibacteria bacterium]|nr:hypothetical protein [Vicinamibacteria bacterium]
MPPGAELQDASLRDRLLFGVALWGLGSFAVSVAGRITYPFDLEWMESGMMSHVLRLSEGRPLYGPPSLDFVPFAYAPLYPAVAAALSPLTGVSYAAARAVSVAGFLLALVAAYAFLRGERVPRAVALAGAALPAAAFAPTGAWYDLVRVDSLFLGLLSAGVFLLWRGRHRDGQVAVAALVLVAAAFTKQTAAPFIAFVTLAFVLVDRRRLGVLAAVFALAGGGAYAWLRWRSQGWFWTYTVGMHAQHEFDRWVFWGATPLRVALLLGPALAFVPWMLARRVRGGFAYASGLAAVALVVAMLGAGPIWAYHNALIPAVYFGAVAVALAVARALEAPNLPGWTPTVAPLAMAASVAAAGGGLVALVDRAWPSLGLALPTAYDPRAVWPGPEDLGRGQALVDRLRAEPGAVFVPFHPFYAHRAGKTATLHAMNLADLNNAGLGTPRELVEAIRGRRFSLIVLDEEDGPGSDDERLRQAVAQFPRLAGHYELVERIEGPRTISGAPVRPRYLLRPKR